MEQAGKIRSLPAEVREAVNACVEPHFPSLVDEGAGPPQGGVGFYGDVFLG